MWQPTRVGDLHRILACNCTVFGKRSTFDLLIVLSLERHSLDGVRQMNNKETEALICNQWVGSSSPCEVP